MNERVSKVVLGGSWNWYFLTEANYYYLDKDGRTALSSKEGAEKALNALGNMMFNLKKIKKEVYLLLGNPFGYRYDPHLYVNRLAMAGSFLPDKHTVFDGNQRQLRSTLIDLARRSGVSIIDPYATLCEDNKCERISETDTPIFKDLSHFNPDWAIDHTSYIDVSIGP
jgi:hypothetical protein